MQDLREMEYTCTKCNHQQTIRYFLDDQPLPVTCCVSCRAGFGIELHSMMQMHIGMFPGEAKVIPA